MNKIDVRRKIVFRYFFLGEELNMKKILLALLLAAVMGAGAGAAEIDDTIDGVWGVKFGTSVAEANRIMTEQNAAVLLCEYSYVPNYHEAFYKVNFFGREGHLLLRFSKRGLFLARFAFIRAEQLPAAAPQRADVAENEHKNKKEKKYLAFSRNFTELNAMLTRKYGAPKAEYAADGAVSGYQWITGTFGRRSVALFENRSLSRNDTVLSYEDASRK